jgi:hypothetical protein
MRRCYVFSVFSAVKCFFLVFACIGYAGAETLPVGPVDLTVRVNDVDIVLVLKGVADVNTAKGDFNINGEVTASSATSKLRDEVLAVAGKFLPIKFKKLLCTFTINRISSLDLSSKDGEADADVGFHFVQSCPIISDQEFDATAKLALVAKVLKGNRLSWIVPRNPELHIPGLGSNLSGQSARELLQGFLDKDGIIQIPPIDGVRAALQGANFDGDKNTLSFRIKADAHTDAAKLTSLLAQFLKTQKFSITIPKSQ